MTRPSHHTDKGFRNPWPDERDYGSRDFLRWRRERKYSGRPRFAEVVGTLPLVATNWPAIDSPGDSLVLTWIGHATFLLQMNGLNILTDPVFGERSSPVPFGGPGRVTDMPLDQDRLPQIDYVVISHNHYDHLDKGVVRLLGDGPTWLVPLGLGAWFARQGVNKVVELDWWDREGLVNRGEVICVPARHFSSRSIWDRNKTLWAGWVLATAGRRVYFAGDTGYGPHFAEIGERIGHPDLALLPIGAYRPEWFMLPIHLNPRQAVQAHLDLRAERTVGMHWGTFILSDEPLMEPPRLFRHSARQEGLSDEEIIVLRHGQTIIVP
ncbi:MAG: MBL fold metallo-hydrolase [Fidelibacterota bacterium]|nr:MAG: MBL fold metallo-hydrolase [Candidatus Neomarinimicrobiota bacterium]